VILYTHNKPKGGLIDGMETPLKDSPNIDTDFWEQIKSDIMEINGK
jgi:hypothetical protein